MDQDVDTLVSAFRRSFDLHHDLGSSEPGVFVNPCEAVSVLAEDFLRHLEVDRPEINRVLKKAYPYLDRNLRLKRDVHARLKAFIWMTLKGENQVATGWKGLAHNVDAQRAVGFAGDLPCYDTMRDFVNERLPNIFEELCAALLSEQRRYLPNLGKHQVEDATPLEARRRDTEAPYHPHYQTRMQKLELRWDVEAQALLASQFYKGTANEGRWLTILTRRLEKCGVAAATLTIDGGYTSFLNIALAWRHGARLLFRRQDAWNVNVDQAKSDVMRRYQTYWKHPDFLADTSIESKLRFLIDHGTEDDVEAAGRYLRDQNVQDESNESRTKAKRSMNEALNAAFKNLPIRPARKGAREQFRRTIACVITIHAVQLTRLQNGVTTQLCRTANIL